MTPLSIFRLPQLVFIKIINSMNPAEQFLTALSSRKAYCLVKNNRSKAISLTLHTYLHRFYLLDEQKRIYKRLELFAASKDCFEIRKEEKSIDINEHLGLKCCIDNREWCDAIFICWKEQRVGFRNMLALAFDLFRIVHVDIVQIQRPEDIWIAGWFKEQQITLEALEFYDWNEKFADEDIKHVIVGSTAQELYLNVTPTANFQIQNFPNTFGLFFCSPGFWITNYNLMAIDCVELLIDEKNFTCRELNQFLNHWINGGSLRLKYLQIGVDEYNQDDVFAGIQNQLTRVPGDRVYTRPYRWKFTFNGLQLHRKDGVIASIQYSEGLLRLGVWPDANGNA